MNEMEYKWYYLCKATCPLCDGRTTFSSMYKRRFCAQANGACGKLWLRQTRCHTKAEFTRTTINQDGNLYIISHALGRPSFEAWFIGGEQVTKATYIGFGPPPDQVAALSAD